MTSFTFISIKGWLILPAKPLVFAAVYAGKICRSSCRFARKQCQFAGRGLGAPDQQTGSARIDLRAASLVTEIGMIFTRSTARAGIKRTPYPPPVSGAGVYARRTDSGNRVE